MNTFSSIFRRGIYEWLYWSGKPRWDTGITPPEVVEVIEREDLPRGLALDIGCGTGTNAIYLAKHGLRVTGIDFVPRAIQQARTKARTAQVNVDFEAADVLAPRALGPFDFVLDIGCFHNFAGAARQRYAENLARWTRPGARYLVYAFYPTRTRARAIGLTPEEMDAAFAPTFRLIRSTAGENRPGQDSAWYYWERL